MNIYVLFQVIPHHFIIIFVISVGRACCFFTTFIGFATEINIFNITALFNRWRVFLYLMFPISLSNFGSWFLHQSLIKAIGGTMEEHLLALIILAIFIHKSLGCILGSRMQVTTLSINVFSLTIIPWCTRDYSLLWLGPYSYVFSSGSLNFIRRMYKFVLFEALHVLFINLNVFRWINICASYMVSAHVHIFNKCVRILSLLSLIVLYFGSLRHSLEPLELFLSDIPSCKTQCVHVSVLVKVHLSSFQSLLCEH